MTAVVFAGFAPTYYLRPLFEAQSLPWLYQVHGLLFTAWMLLLIVQPVLVAARRTDIHRRIGPVGGALALLMVIAALAVTIDLGRRAPAPPPGAPPLMVFLSVPFATLVVFPVLVGAALYWRRNADAHKRLMLIATLELLPAGVARWPALAPLGPLAYFGGTDLFLVAIIGFDLLTKHRIHAATIWGGAFLLLSQIGRIAIGGTDAWQTFAAWLIS